MRDDQTPQIPQATQLKEHSEVGEALKARRKSQGVTQELLADYSGVSRVSLIKIERGGDLRLSTLLKLTELLGLEVVIKPRELR